MYLYKYTLVYAYIYETSDTLMFSLLFNASVADIHTSCIFIIFCKLW